MKTYLGHDNWIEKWVDNLLIYRGVDKQQLDNLKYPSVVFLNDPRNLQNCERSAAQILEWIKENKKFGLIIDDDVDGICSAAIVYNYLKETFSDIEIQYFFHKGKEHGLSDCYQDILNAKVEVVLELDAGINDVEFHDILGQAGIFTSVWDHHNYENKGFSSYGFYVDNQLSDNYTNKSLAGCGVSWQLCRMIDKIVGAVNADKYIDLVALGCAADVMSPLTLENRYIFDAGFSHVSYPAFVELINLQAYFLKDGIDYTSAAFYIAPLINAVMRSGTLDEKSMMYKFFLEFDELTDAEIAKSKSMFTSVKNRQNRLVDKYLLKIKARITQQHLNENNIIIISLSEDDTFDAALNGLISMKLSSEYKKPSMVIRACEDGISKGSMRNCTNSPIPDLQQFILQSPHVNFVAGHANSSGVGIYTDKLNEFIDWFNLVSKDLDFNSDCYNIDFEITYNDHYFAELVYDIAINNALWGGDNPTPIIKISNIPLTTSNVTYMGAKKDTIKINVNGVACMIFKNVALASLLTQSQDLTITALGKAKLNKWNGTVTPQLIIDRYEIEKLNPYRF